MKTTRSNARTPHRISWVVMLFLFSLQWLPITSGINLHETMSITGDEDFTVLGFPGSGTQRDPYRIEGLRIEAGPGRMSCIEVKNTLAYFVIRECELYSSYIGVSIVGVADGTATIEGNMIIGTNNDGGGITLSANGVNVTGNTCNGFVEGIHTNYADNCNIIYNNFSFNEYHGVSLRYSKGCLVAHNHIEGNKAYGAIIIRTSYNNTLYNNTFIDNSGMESYDWDSIYSFTVTSQGLDEGDTNKWYDEALSIGNWWSDYMGEGEYAVDGTGHAVDVYPMQFKETSGTPVEEPGVGISGYGLEVILLGLMCVLYLRSHMVTARA